MIAEVLIEYNTKNIDKTFSYLIPSFLEKELKKGMKVKVPFGKKLVNGFVVDIKPKPTDIAYELKEIKKIEDKFLVLDDEMLCLADYLSKMTLCSRIAAIQTMLPSNLKVKDKKYNLEKYDTYVTLNISKDKVREYILNNKRSVKQKEILTSLLKEEKILKKDLGSSGKSLLEKGLIKEVKEQKYRIVYTGEKKEVHTLTEAQSKAYEEIKKYLNTYETILLYGVTGSGKTEIYMTLMQEVIKNKKKALLLVPEITLTTQIVKRFYEVFGREVAIFHSSLSLGEKQDEYERILKGEVSIVIGTRSAVFTPIKDLGIIIIDEEHSENFKQETMPRYHTLDMAKFRAQYNNCPLLLGSATPSLETMARAQKGVYKLVTLDKRVGSSLLPEVTLVDMAMEMRKRNPYISSLLQTKIYDRLSKNEQIILLLNRRGFSTIVTCQNCGYTYKCPNCDISLTYHKSSNSLRCHYCGASIIKSDECPACHEKSLNFLGLGTEKLETELKRMFPIARIIRMDVDTTTLKGSHERIINDFKEGKYDILLGTQMISKGLDFPKVTLVGVINADTSLNIPDFRSSERTFALLTQAAGRSGRSSTLGEVIIQTFNPDNFTLECVRKQDYNKFYNYEMQIRKKLSYPPYYYLVSIRISSKDYDKASREALKVKNFLSRNLEDKTIILGPTTASLFRVNNIYRFQIILKYQYDKKLDNTLRELDKRYVGDKDVYLEIDNNPLHI